MRQNIHTFLEELYALDPGLRQKEEQLLKILADMIASRPDIEFNDAFKAELRNKILLQIAEEKKRRKAGGIDWNSILMGFFLGGASIAFASFAVFQFVAPASLHPTLNSVATSSGSLAMVSPLDFSFKKSQKSDAAFGVLRPSDASSVGASAGKQISNTLAPTSPLAASTSRVQENGKISADPRVAFPQ